MTSHSSRCRPFLKTGGFAFALFYSFTAAVVGQSVREVVSDADAQWVDSWAEESQRLEETISSAYALDADGRAALRTELEARIVQQKEFEAKMQAELQAMSAKMAEAGTNMTDDSSPEVDAYARKWWELTQRMPLYDTQVAEWIEPRLPPETAREGRQRLEELITHRLSTMGWEQERTQAASSRKATILKESRAITAEISREYSRPRPEDNYGEIAEVQDRVNQLDRVVRPNRPRRGGEAEEQYAVADAPMHAPPTVPTSPQQRPGAAAPVPRPTVQPPGQASRPLPPGQPAAGAAHSAREVQLAPAPPLDEWDKHMLATAQKYNFDDRQLTNARSILSDLRRRAYQYQISRAEEYARAELMTDAKARVEHLKALNKPFDALFEELKLRLESLPTLSQRNKAAGSPAKR